MRHAVLDGAQAHHRVGALHLGDQVAASGKSAHESHRFGHVEAALLLGGRGVGIQGEQAAFAHDERVADPARGHQVAPPGNEALQVRAGGLRVVDATGHGEALDVHAAGAIGSPQQIVHVEVRRDDACARAMPVAEAVRAGGGDRTREAEVRPVQEPSNAAASMAASGRIAVLTV